MNDCIRNKVCEFTEENKADLQVLVLQAVAKCTVRSDVFVNHSDFYPKLDPEYAKLVPRYTQAAQEAGATVHDGAAWRGRITLRDTMHFAAESTPEVVEMYISAVHSMLGEQPPRHAAQDADDRMAVEQEIALSGDDDDPPDPQEEWLPRDQEEQRESAEEVREQLLEKFNLWNEGLVIKKDVPICLLETKWLLPTRMPAWLPRHDDRFHAQKKSRVFVCDTDGCGQVVCFSSEQNQTRFRRADCEFAGSFSCQLWNDLPPCLRYEAWAERLIDATWHCAHTCGADTTLNEHQKKARLDRIHAWQKGKREDAGKGSATASSSAAGSANPTSGKGAAKAGKRKRTLEGKQKGTGKGKKGLSKDQGQASRRRTG